MIAGQRVRVIADGWTGVVLDGPPAGWSQSVVDSALAKGKTVFVDHGGRGYCRCAYRPGDLEPAS